MLIRMFVNNIILSVLLLAGVSLCTAEEDGYEYSRPSVGFNTGLNSFGSQYSKPTEYVVASSTPQPAAVYDVKPQVSLNQGFGQNVQQYKAPIVNKPQTLLGGSSSFAQSTSSLSRPVLSSNQFGQYQNNQQYQSPLNNFGSNQGFGQSSSSSGYGQYVSGQYKSPVISVVSKPQTTFGDYLGLGQSSSAIGAGQYVSGQYKAPVVKVTSKPLTNFGAYQGLGQSSTIGAGQYVSGQYKAPVVKVTSKPQTSFGAFQGFGQSSSTSGSGQYVSGQYKAPVVRVTSKPQTGFGAFQGYGQSSSINGGGQYVSGQYKAPVVKVTSKPLTNFGAYQGFGQSSSTSGSGQYVSGQYKAPVISVTSKPQTNFGAYQGFGQSTSQYQPTVSIAATPKPSTYAGSKGFSQSNLQTRFGFGQSKPSNQYGQQSSKPIVLTGTVVHPVIVSAKPQSSFGQSKPSNQYGQQSSKPIVLTGTVVQPVYISGKPQSSSSGSKPSNQYGQQSSKPIVLTGTVVKPVYISGKPQGNFNGFQGFGHKFNQQPFKSVNNFASAQTGQYQSLQYQKPSVGYSQTSSAFSQYQKPQATYGSFQGSFGNTGSSNLPPSKPVVSTSTIEIQPTLKPEDSQNIFQGASSTVAPDVITPLQTLSTPAPVIVTAKPQTVFNAFQGSLSKPLVNTQTGFQGYGQSGLKPAVVQYQKPVVFTTPKPIFKQPIVQYQKPLVSTPIKSQSAFGSFSGFGQSSYQKPAASQTYYTPSTTVKPQLSYLPPKAQVQPVSVIQSASEKYTSTPTTLKPFIVTSKPQSAFSGFGQSVNQKPAVNTFNTFGQQSATQYSVKPLIVTPRPQTALSGYGQSIYQKPAVSTFNTFGQQSVTKYTSTPTTVKPFAVTAKPQSAFSGFGQSIYQKPAASAFNNFGQQSVTKYTSTPTTVKPFTVTAKPQSAFSGFGQSIYQTPAVSTFNTYGQQSATKYTSTPTTVKPFTVTVKPQTAFSGFGQSIYQKPAVSAFNNFGQQSVTKYTSTPITAKPFTVTAKPQSAFSGFGQSIYQKPAVSTFNTFGQQSATKYTNTPITVKPLTAFGGYEQSVYQKPVIVSTTARPQAYVVSTTLAPSPTLTPDSLTYLPPKGSNVPLNAVSASGAVSESFFELPSATANQVVDVAQEQKVGGFVADQGFRSQSSVLPTITNQVSSDGAQEQKVEGIDLRSSKLAATNKGQELEFFSGNNGVGTAPAHSRTARDTYSNGGYQDEYIPPTGYLSYQGNPITTQQFGGVQPNSYQGVPYQQIAQAQSSLGINDGTAFDQETYQTEQASASNVGAQNQDPYNFEGQYGYISSVEDQQQKIPQNYQEAASYTDAVNTSDSAVQDPQPLNREEQQVRQMEEKSDNNFQNLQPGSYIGPHVNKNSDHEYNVFDYDQYSKDPEDADV